MASYNGGFKYIYQLPYFQRRELCRILDRMDKWEELGGVYMNFDMMTIQDLRREILRGNSPSDELLTIWGHQNHTILELFKLLSEMQHYQAMLILKPFVPPKYHRLIYEGEEILGSFLNGERSLPTENKVSAEMKEAVVAGKETGGPGNVEASRLLSDKNMDVGNHNLNMTESSNFTQDKLNFSEQPERKILNIERSSRAPVPQLANEAGGFLRLLPFSEDKAEKLLPENKENNAPGCNQYRKMSNASDISSVAENYGALPQIDYHELVVATDNWSKQNILGKGGFGTVFNGIWRNTKVAVKRMEQRGAESAESNQAQLDQSLRELRILNSCRHDNILPLYGFSVGGGEPCLVYQFMPNGSLEDRLLCRQGTKSLSWLQRHNIAQGTARGLQFLHNNPKPFIHGDVKSANILLDLNFVPRIGDFGLAREGPQNNYTHLKVSRVHGTRPYLPDEFLRGKQISPKVDTYSFGIVLFELATGLRAYDDSRANKLLKEHVENCKEEELGSLIDMKAVPEDPMTFQNLVSLGIRCVSKRPRDRPEMEVVLKELENMASRHQPLDRIQYTGAASSGRLHIKTNSPVSNIQQGVHNYHIREPPNGTTAQNFQPLPDVRLITPNPLEHTLQNNPQMPYHHVSTLPQSDGTASNPFYHIASPCAIGVVNAADSLPKSEETSLNEQRHFIIPAAVGEVQCTESQDSSNENIPDLEGTLLTPIDSADDIPNAVGVDNLPNLSILGVSCTHTDKSSVSGLDTSASATLLSSAQGKDLMF